ncbi:MAG: hypothetical protein JST80_09220 [Bdellovibrionales bacterium]|nr:hypothetical protein [Bdellovibrionales bacterium]
MIQLLDDFTHIGQSCLRLDTQPMDRFAVVAINCALGESVDHARFASLAFILATLVILDRVFFRDRDWKRVLLWAVHPLVLIPFFWASQITTSMTAFWASVWTLIFIRWLPQPRDPKMIAWLAVWSILGAAVRFEALAYGFVFLALFFWFNRTWLAARKRVATGLAISTAGMLLGKVLVRLIPAHAPHMVTEWGTVSDALNEAHFYPLATYPFLQLDSIGRYLEGFFLPWKISFYGDWYQWWSIHEALWMSPLRLAFWSAAIFGGSFLIKNREWRGRIRVGLLFFVGCTAALSSLPRNDWYYPVRAYLGTLCLLVCLTPLILRRKVVYGATALLFAASSLAHITMHYSDGSSFVAYESEIAGGAHPFMAFDEAKLLLKAGKPDEAIKALHEVYEKIPVESARTSARAGAFWSLSLYYAWIIYEKQVDRTKADEVLKVLRDSTYYPAVHACLQADYSTPEQCLDGERKGNFCGSLTYAMPRLETVRPYRVDPEKICGFEPYRH